MFLTLNLIFFFVIVKEKKEFGVGLRYMRSLQQKKKHALITSIDIKRKVDFYHFFFKY